MKVCVMDPGSGLCQGCKRSLDEIVRWGAMTEAERHAIMAALAARKLGSDADAA